MDPVDTSIESQQVAIIDYNNFANYVRKTATHFLTEDDVIPPAFNFALEDKNSQECIRKFLSDPQVDSLYIQRSCIKGKETF